MNSLFRVCCGLASALVCVCGLLVAEEVPMPEPEPVPMPEKAYAAVPAQATGIDGTVVAGTVEKCSATEVVLMTPQGAKTLRLADLIGMEFQSKNKERPSGFEVLFLDGSSVYVSKIDKSTEDELQVESAMMGGAVKLPVDRLLGVVLGAEENAAGSYRQTLKDRSAKSDYVLLKTLDSVSGRLVFETWKDQELELSVEGEKRAFKDGEAKAVKFQILDEKVELPALHVQVVLVNGAQLAGTLAGAEAGKILLNVQNVKLPILTGAICRIRVIGSRMQYLSTLPPESNVQYPMLKNLPVAFIMHGDRTAAGKPISLASKPYESGIGVHAFSHLTYVLDKKYERFHATVGIDDNVAKPGKVGYRVVVDGKERASGVLDADKRIQKVDIDIKDVRKMELVVHFADESDRGDSVVWAGARLIKAD